MKTARRIVAMMLVVLLVSVMFIGCGQEAAPVDDAAPAVSETAVIIDEEVVEEAPVVEEVAIVEEAPVVEEVASAGTADSDATMDLMLYMIETSGWHTVNSKETVTVTPAGGTFTFSFDTDHITLSNVGSMYIKDKNVNMELTSKSIFSSVSIALEKYSINGVEFDTLNKDASGNLIYEEGIASRGVFDYAFVNQWWTDGLKLSNCEIPEFRSSYAFNGTELYTDKLNHFELTFSIKPIDAANILDEAETRRELRYVEMSTGSAALMIDELKGTYGSIELSCNAVPAVCERYERDWDSMIRWSSSNPAVATVSSDGVVTAVSEGTAVITAKYYDHATHCSIAVTTKPTAIVGLYASVNWGDNVGNTVAINSDSVGQTYTLNVSWGNQGWWAGIHSIYLKDTSCYAADKADENNTVTTPIPNTIITLNSMTYNGQNIELTNNEGLWVGSDFNAEIVNFYWTPNNRVADDQLSNNGNGYDLTDENGNAIAGVTGGEVVVEFTVDSVSE